MQALRKDSILSHGVTCRGAYAGKPPPKRRACLWPATGLSLHVCLLLSDFVMKQNNTDDGLCLLKVDLPS